MDDQQTYLLNGLLNRHFSLGRIVRFRSLERGRQATAYEIFTAAEKEFLVLAYPSTYDAADLEHRAGIVNAIDEQRFSVVPFQKAKSGAFVAEGLQGGHLLVSLNPTGSVQPANLFTEHDVSQLGLRLAWMHRLLREHASSSSHLNTCARMEALFSQGNFPDLALKSQALLESLRLPMNAGWAHGDIGAKALLWDADRQLRTIVDWALLHEGSPLEDLVDSYLAFCTIRGQPIREKARALFESYNSLINLQRTAWTPVVALWCAHRLLAAAHRRPLPENFAAIFESPEQLAIRIGHCVKV